MHQNDGEDKALFACKLPVGGMEVDMVLLKEVMEVFCILPSLHPAFALSLQVDAQLFGTKSHNRKWDNTKGSFPEKWVQSVFSLSHKLGKLSKCKSVLKCDCCVTAGLNVLYTNVVGFSLTSGAITDTGKHIRTPKHKYSCSHPSLSGLTMLRSFGNHDDKLTVLGVQVLQVE